MLPSIQLVLVSFPSHPRMVVFRETMLFVDVVVCLEHDLRALWSLLGSGFWTRKTSGGQPMAFGGFGIWLGGYFGSGGRLCTRFLGSQVHADGSGPGSQVHADGSGQGRKGNSLVCTRGQGPHQYTRPRASSVHAEWFCCMYTFVLTAVYFVCSMCAGCQVQVFSSLTAVYFVCSMCASCQVHNNAFGTCVKYVPKQSIA